MLWAMGDRQGGSRNGRPAGSARRAPRAALQPGFGFDGAPDGRSVPRRFRPMVASPAPGPFDDPAYLFEPWWPGARVIAFVHAGRVRVQADELADVLDAFPELADLPPRLAADEAVVEGTVVVLDPDARPDARLLRARLAGDASAAPGPGRAGFVATDLLELDGRRLRRAAFVERRERLVRLVETSDWCTVSRGYPGEGRELAAAAADLGFSALSAHRLDAPYRAGPAGDAWLRVPIPGTPEPPARLPPFLAVFRRLPLDDAG